VRGGKLEFAGLPLMITAVMLQMQDFLRSDRRKTGISRHTADEYGGNVAFATFTPF